jgi:hypothetical protein|nr:MAG TPA: endonuclease-like protein [Caudoviricetes sp.]
MLKESGNLIEEGIPITKELLDFAKANNYKISLKTGDYRIGELKANRAKNNPMLMDQIGKLYLDGAMYPTKYCDVFGMGKAGFANTIKRILGDRYIPATEIYPEEIQHQFCQSCLENLGVEYPSQSKMVRAKVEATNLHNIGVKCNLQLIDHSGDNNSMKKPETRAKSRATCLKNLGVEYPMQSKAVREKSKKTLIDDLGVDNAMKSQSVIDERYENFSIIRKLLQHQRGKLDPTSETDELFLGLLTPDGEIDMVKVSEFIVGNYKRSRAGELLKMLNLKTATTYTTEIKMRNDLTNIGCTKMEYSTNPKDFANCRDLDFVQNARKLHGVRFGRTYRDMDFYFPNLKLGIEINGRAHHSVNKDANGNPKTKDYHFEKFKAFHESGILMISFTDYEQDFFTEDYINIIKFHLGLLKREDLRISKEFLEFNQISNIEESLNYGLFDPSRFTGNFEDHQHQRFIEDFEYWDCGVIR